MAGTTSTPMTRLTKHARDTRSDSAAGALIFLVVLGHVLELLPGDAPSALRIWIYMFHMPAFVWISGYVTNLSRSWSVRRLVATLLFPFLVFQVIQRFIESTASGHGFDLKLPNPAWTLWYLLALFVWRLASPVLKRTPWFIVVATVASVLVGVVPFIGYGFAGARILGFLPFFVIGLHWRKEWFERLARYWWAGAVALAVAAAWAIQNASTTNIKTWYFAVSYDRFDLAAADGAAQRLLILATSAVLVLAFFSICYRTLPLFSSIGRYTLPVYLLQAVAIYPWIVNGLDWSVTGIAAVALSTLVSLIFAVLASRPKVALALTPLTNLEFWLSRETRPAQKS